MTPTTTPMRYYLTQTTRRKFTLAEYHKIIARGVLAEGDPCELLEGNLILKSPRGVAHNSAMDAFEGLLPGVLPPDWFVRGQRAVTFTDSETEPDYAIVRGPRSRYRDQHPGPGDVGLLVEVSASSLLVDRHDKGSIYAGAGVPVYWVVNVVDKVIEVHTQPTGTGEAAAYGKCDVFAAGASVPVVLDGATIGTVPVADVVG